jgi:hypothetical protein
VSADVARLSVQLVDKNVGDDVVLATALTSALGKYSICVEIRGKSIDGGCVDEMKDSADAWNRGDLPAVASKYSFVFLKVLRRKKMNRSTRKPCDKGLN